MSDLVLRPRPDNQNFHTVREFNGWYKYLKLSLNNKSDDSISLSDTNEMLEWKLPAASVYNKGRAILGYTLEVGAAATSKYNYMHEIGLPWASAIEFVDGRGQQIVNLQYANRYLSTAPLIDMREQELDLADPTSGLYKPVSGLPADNIYPPGYTTTVDDMWAVTVGANKAATSPQEPTYAVMNPVQEAGTSDSVMAFHKQFPFSQLKGTALGMDRDEYFFQEMYLRITTEKLARVAYYEDTNTVAGTNPVKATSVTLSNVYLYLPIQQDDAIKLPLIAKCKAGHQKYQVPYTIGRRNTTTGSGSRTIQIQMTSQEGQRVKRILHIPFAATETLTTSYDHHNVGASKISAYRTVLDTVQLQNEQISCARNRRDDWRIHKDLLRDSAIKGIGPYTINWFHMDSFSNPRKDHGPVENVDEGLPLTVHQPQRKWQIEMETAVDLNHYTFVLYQRELVLDPLTGEFQWVVTLPGE